MTLALCGYATRFHKIIEHYGNRKMVMPGAFDKSLVPRHSDYDSLAVTG
jgi:phage head maturation protease